MAENIWHLLFLMFSKLSSPFGYSGLFNRYLKERG